jgi:hypothetical protein
MSDLPVVTGSCLCAAVTFKVTLPPVRFVQCHCSRCRRSTGSASAANLAVRPAQFTWVTGQELVRRYELAGAERFGRCFCDRCGSPVPRTTRDGALVIVPAGAIHEDAALPRPEPLFTDSCARWAPA